MIFNNEMAFKAKMKSLTKENKLLPQQVQQNYLIERFLIRLAKSEYASLFIIKGGFLIGNLVGLGARTTMDLDTTVKKFELTEVNLSAAIQEILATPVEDSFELTLAGIGAIREVDDYPGYRVKIRVVFGYLDEQVTIDVTTGDRITPSEVEFKYQMIFEDETLLLASYNLETLLAEKIETVLSRREVNTRPRDYYDLYILHKLYFSKVDLDTLRDALNETAQKRGSGHLMKDVPEVIRRILDSDLQNSLWSKYQKQYVYARELSLLEVMTDIEKLLNQVVAKNMEHY